MLHVGGSSFLVLTEVENNRDEKKLKSLTFSKTWFNFKILFLFLVSLLWCGLQKININSTLGPHSF